MKKYIFFFLLLIFSISGQSQIQSGMLTTPPYPVFLNGIGFIYGNKIYGPEINYYQRDFICFFFEEVEHRKDICSNISEWLYIEHLCEIPYYKTKNNLAIIKRPLLKFIFVKDTTISENNVSPAFIGKHPQYYFIQKFPYPTGKRKVRIEYKQFPKNLRNLVKGQVATSTEILYIPHRKIRTDFVLYHDYPCIDYKLL